jgi:predicted nucleic acid-binding protein
MKLVLDTNVLVSGLLNQSGPPGYILQHIAFPDIIIC